jgi:hypothetical protein
MAGPTIKPSGNTSTLANGLTAGPQITQAFMDFYNLLKKTLNLNTEPNTSFALFQSRQNAGFCAPFRF